MTNTTIAQDVDTIAKRFAHSGAHVARGTFTVRGYEYVVTYYPASMVASAYVRDVRPDQRRAVALRGRALVTAVLRARGLEVYRTRSRSVATGYISEAWGARG